MAPNSTTKRKSLCSLPPDILSRIVDFLAATSPASLSRLSLVNTQLHHLAQYSQHQIVHLQILDESLIKRCRLIKSASLEVAVRHLIIFDRRGSNDRLKPEYQHHIDTICSILPKLTGLKSLAYRGNDTPAAILDALPPHVKLEATFPGSTEWDPAEEQLLRLCNNRNLSTLDVQLTWVEDQECRRIMGYLKRVLLSCPNLRSLTLDVSQPTSGCVIYQPSGEYVGLGFEHGERPPALEELNLISYDFGRVPGASEIDYWVNAFDWSKLKMLKTGYEEFALKVADKLTALEEVHFLERWWNPTMHEFLGKVGSSLRAITAPTLRSVSMDGLTCHSTTLERLRLHRREDYDNTWKDDCVDLNDLRRLQSDFPLLRELSIDIARSGSWPLATLDVLASFPRLRDLDLCFELGLHDSESLVTPLLTFDTARYVCEYLSSRSRTLQQIRLRSGAPPAIGFGLPSVESYWPQHNSTSFACEVAPGNPLVVTCPKLEQREKDFRRCEHRQSSIRRPLGVAIRDLLQKTLRPGRYRRRKAAEDFFIGCGQQRRRRDEAAQVAREGPTPVSRWEGHYW